MVWLDTIYGNLGIVFFIVIAGITALAVIRSVIKMKKRKAINITPVGVFNDLPESVTGIKKTKDWERKEENQPSACPGLVPYMALVTFGFWIGDRIKRKKAA